MCVAAVHGKQDMTDIVNYESDHRTQNLIHPFACGFLLANGLDDSFVFFEMSIKRNKNSVDKSEGICLCMVYDSVSIVNNKRNGNIRCQITSHRLSGPWIIPLFICMPALILKLARMRCLSGPELNLYKRSNSAKKCVSSSFAIKCTPHTGHEFDGGVPIFDTFFIAVK